MDLSLKEAKDIIEVALKTQASKKFKPMAVAVLSSSGSLRACECQDGTSPLRPKIAHGKAFGAISLGLGSRALFERAKQEPFFIQSMNSLFWGRLFLSAPLFFVIALFIQRITNYKKIMYATTTDPNPIKYH